MGAEEEKSGIKAIMGFSFPEDECWENWWKEKLPVNIMIQYQRRTIFDPELWYDLILAIRIGRLTRAILPAPLVASSVL